MQKDNCQLDKKSQDTTPVDFITTVHMVMWKLQ